MLSLLVLGLCFIATVNSDLLTQEGRKGVTLRPISVCCDIPEIGDPEPLANCSNLNLPGPCKDIQCAFEKSGFLIDKHALNKEAYINHLRRWSDKHVGWSEAIEKAIVDCVNKDLRQYLEYPCRAYDVFACTTIAMLKKCPKEAWKC